MGGEKPRSLLQFYPIPDQTAKIQKLKNDSWNKKVYPVDPRTTRMVEQNEKLRLIQKEEFKVKQELMCQLLDRKQTIIKGEVNQSTSNRKGCVHGQMYDLFKVLETH